MPKIIANLEQRLIDEARRQIEEVGYNAVTIRSVAKGCGVGVGTVYNYFASKDALIAAYLLHDWIACVAEINGVSEASADATPVARCIYDNLLAFARRHEAVFRDAAAMAGFAGSFSSYHGLLRSQLAQPLRKFCGDDFSAEFIAESLLTWTLAGKSFAQIDGMIKKLF